MKPKIKSQFRKEVVIFGDNALVLGKRTPGELVALGILAHQSKDKTLQNYFERLPALETLQKYKTEVDLGKTPNWQDSFTGTDPSEMLKQPSQDPTITV